VGPLVRLNTDGPGTRLQHRLDVDDEDEDWTDVCAGICAKHLSPKGMYRLGGRSLRPTDPFQLPRSSGTVFIEGKMGTTGKYYTGVGLTVGGAFEALAGVILLGTASSTTGDYSKGLSNKDFYSITGALSLVRAAILLGIGISLVVRNSSSAKVR